MIDIEKYKKKALQILSPIKPINIETTAVNDFLFRAKKSKASKLLPEYYLIFFLLSDLLGFENLGQFEKIAWSFPIDYNGKAFLVEYRKFGVGIFMQNESDEEVSQEIVRKISGAVKSIRPYYGYLAEQAVDRSEFNIINNNKQLFERFEYLLELYNKEYERLQEGSKRIGKKGSETVFSERLIELINIEYIEKSNWLAISCIEAFFSWTEHLFIHLAIIGSKIKEGKEVVQLIEKEWKYKYKTAIPLKSSGEAEKFYNELTIIKNQIRNFVAHGAFGKDGNAFKFHSNTGAVPVLINHNQDKNKFSLNYELLTFKENDVIWLIKEFIKFLWSDDITAPAMEYTQKYQLPTILPYSADGTYESACESIEKMREFADKLAYEFDRVSNMDW